MLIKPNKINRFPQNYGPISLLPTMNKVAETIIRELRRHSTEQQILSLVEYAAAGHLTEFDTQV